MGPILARSAAIGTQATTEKRHRKVVYAMCGARASMICSKCVSVVRVAAHRHRSAIAQATQRAFRKDAGSTDEIACCIAVVAHHEACKDAAQYQVPGCNCSGKEVRALRSIKIAIEKGGGLMRPCIGGGVNDAKPQENRRPQQCGAHHRSKQGSKD